MDDEILTDRSWPPSGEFEGAMIEQFDDDDAPADERVAWQCIQAAAAARIFGRADGEVVPEPS